eukprot:TRINITY_DN11115_c0_g1_i1.p1 TRINITY_DN11115_c0_g1~~TRINITY_DN11115_c0_g1_i1.p1  ORF type:complete len:284 (-),score=16.11 TRINITY_DN11115_c0_g1_i1:126-977(-)
MHDVVLNAKFEHACMYALIAQRSPARVCNVGKGDCGRRTLRKWLSHQRSSYATVCRASDYQRHLSDHEKACYEQAWGCVLALDVDFIHYQSRHTTRPHLRTHVFPAEVCVVSLKDEVTYHTFIQPDQLEEDWTWKGGVPASIAATGSTLAQVQQDLTNLLAPADRVVGYGLRRDLEKLQLQALLLPSRLTCLTSFAKMKRPRSHPYERERDLQPYTLKAMASKYLGYAIQIRSRRHSAVEDAVAVMRLYRDHVLDDPCMLSRDDLDAFHQCKLCCDMARSLAG